MRHAPQAEFPGRQRRSLVSRPRLVHPDVDRDTLIESLINGRGRRAPFHASQPSGIAMGEDMDRETFFPAADSLDHLHAMLTDLPAGFDVVTFYFPGRAESDPNLFRRPDRARHRA